jgi:ElaB/YqjD/DUF883 family membrane-anchored ribosome-binding protein
MATGFTQQSQHGIGVAEKVAEAVREGLESNEGCIEESVSRAARHARHGVQRASDVRDEASLVIRRQPFKAMALAFGVGAILGVACGRISRARVRTTPRTEDVDIEC